MWNWNTSLAKYIDITCEAFIRETETCHYEIMRFELNCNKGPTI